MVLKYPLPNLSNYIGVCYVYPKTYEYFYQSFYNTVLIQVLGS